MIFHNYTHEKFISDFYSKYEKQLNSLCPPDINFDVFTYSLDALPTYMQETVDFLGEEGVDNPCQCWPNPKGLTPLKDTIIYNPQLQVAYNITDVEMNALLAHEIGHFIYQYSDPKPTQDEEQYCDDIAVKLGLAKDLKSALGKIIPICTANLSMVLEDRIKRL